jgi:hypothetical protein
MKRILVSGIYALAAVLLTGFMTSCSSDKEEVVPTTTAQVTFNAIFDSYNNMTRALSEGTNGIVSTWKTTDGVTVYKKGWTTNLGTLAPKADSETNRTKLDGTVSYDGMNIGDWMDLITPRTDWDYTGQDGTISKISSTYDYAIAEAQVIYMDATDGNKIYATDAHFTPQQAVVKFVLLDKNGDPLNIPSLTIITKSDKLVLRRNLEGTNTTYGNLVITPAAATNTFFVALRNDTKGADTYTLSAKVGDAVYCYTKNDFTIANGKFMTITVTMKDMNDTYTDRQGYDNQGNITWE